MSLVHIGVFTNVIGVLVCSGDKTVSLVQIGDVTSVVGVGYVQVIKL